MKPIITAIASACIVALPSFTHASQMLFSEDWSGIAANTNPTTGGHWIQPNGIASQFAVVENPIAGLTGKWLNTRYTGAGAQVLPKLMTQETFDLTTDGIRFSADVAITDRVNDNNYLRIGLQNASAPQVGYTNNYWFEVFGTYIRVGKATSSGVSNLQSYTFSPEVWDVNTAANIALSITPLSSGAMELTLHLNGEEVIRITDIAGTTPTFDEGFKLVLASRDPRVGYIGNLQLQSIPEGSSYALLLSGAGLLWGAKRYSASLR